MFRLTLKDPLTKINQYLTTLKNADVITLRQHKGVYKAQMLGQRNHLVNRHARNQNNFKTALSCAFVHPVTYERNGYLPCWYDGEMIREWQTKGKPFYKTNGIHAMDKYIESQKPFIEKMQDPTYASSVHITYESLARYEQFMWLLKKYKGQQRMVPTGDIDVVWHAHMLDHRAYLLECDRVFGKIVDHNDDNVPGPVLLNQFMNTRQLWKKEFGTNMMVLTTPVAVGGMMGVAASLLGASNNGKSRRYSEEKQRERDRERERADCDAGMDISSPLHPLNPLNPLSQMNTSGSTRSASSYSIDRDGSYSHDSSCSSSCSSSCGSD